ncbi:hypothetical protein CYJ79_09280, partial [Lactobacillus crispatus]
FFVQTNHTRKELLFLMFKEINLRNHSSLHKLFYSLEKISEFDGVSIIDFNDQNKIISVKEYQSKSQHYYPYSK